jgi:hypothetical protein
MAKKSGLDDIFKKTERTGVKSDPVKPRGVGLKISEWERLDVIAQELGATSHKLATHAIREWIARYTKGEVETVTAQRLPDLD